MAIRLFSAVGLALTLSLDSALAVSLPECITDSQNANPIITSAPCGIFAVIASRQENVNGNALDVTVKYMVHLPLGAPKALVLLFTGGAGNTGIQGDANTGAVTDTGNNFLVRSAQLFAEAGYFTVTIDRPSTTIGFSNAEFDQYRVSARHAHDIVAVLNAVDAIYNTAHLDLFLVGTSRGALSIVAQNTLGIGSLLSSPVTGPGANPDNLWVGTDSPHFRLRPEFMTVPAQVLAHQDDGCAVSTPADSTALHQDLLDAGVSSSLRIVDGGFELNPDPCQATTAHGFLGIENLAAGKITERIDALRLVKHKHRPVNHKPMADSASFKTFAGVPLVINLAHLTSDPDGCPRVHALPHSLSSRGGKLALKGPLAFYFPPSGAANVVDGFVYSVSDNKKGKSLGLITIKIN